MIWKTHCVEISSYLVAIVFIVGDPNPESEFSFRNRIICISSERMITKSGTKTGGGCGRLVD